MSSGDETYLEAFMESLSTQPHLVRRNMDLMRDLDASTRYVYRQFRACFQNVHFDEYYSDIFLRC